MQGDQEPRTEATPQPRPEAGDSGLRWSAAALAVIFAFACGLMVTLMRTAGDWPLCDDKEARRAAECFDGSAGAQAVSLFTGWTSAGLAALTAVLAFLYVVRGRGGMREIAYAGIGALALGAMSALAGSV